MAEPAPQPADARRKRPVQGPASLPERITRPLTQEQLRAPRTDDPWESDEEFDHFLADLAESRSRD
jgi:hypothetical protein